VLSADLPLSGRPDEPIEIAFGAQRAYVSMLGATLLGYAVDDCPVLHPFGGDAGRRAGQGDVLMPWPNRVAGGRYEFAGTLRQLPIDEPERGHAIHGLVRSAPWHVDDRSAEGVRLVHLLRGGPGYPFELQLQVEYVLSPAGLTATLEARNAGIDACPFGAGAHPYFGFPCSRADDIALSLAAEDWLEVDERLVPKGHRPVTGSALDFRRPRAIGASVIDHAFAGLERDRRGLAWSSLRFGSSQIRVWQDSGFPFVHVYTADTLPDARERRHSVAIEPMTCAPDAFNSRDGLLVLGPGESFRSRWGVALG
jgi:aldose 1-epimerase